jgi:hypothetical protein
VLLLLLLLLPPLLVLTVRHVLMLQAAAEEPISVHAVFKAPCSMRRQVASKAMTLCVVYRLSTCPAAARRIFHD